MKLFVDANILISVLNKEYPLFTHSSRILSLADKKGFEVYTSPVCLAIAFYFAEKKYRAAKAKEKIALLCRHIRVAEISRWAVDKALQNAAVLDFEDGLEYYAAVESKCACIITEDTEDFHFADISVQTGEAFLNSLRI